MEKTIKKDGTLQERYVRELCEIIRMSNGRNGRVYGKKWLRNGRHKTLVTTVHDRTLDLLNDIGIKYSLGNDAPKGGVEGDYIEMYFDGRNKAVKFIRSLEPSWDVIRKFNFENADV